LQLDLAGADNFRSLHGIRARDGRYLAARVLLRSGQLCHLTDGDVDRLRNIGLRTVFDLRSDGERNRFPNRLPIGVEQHGLPVLADLRADEKIGEGLRLQPDPLGVRRMMLEIYRRLPKALVPHLPVIFHALRREAVPILIHCAAGKDRTGFAVAVVLHALDIPDDGIMADYMASSRLSIEPSAGLRDKMFRLLRKVTGAPPSDAMIRAILEVRPEYLHAAYDAVRTEWGSMDGYLADTCGLGPTGLRQLRDRWLASD